MIWGAGATNESDKAFVTLMIFCEIIHREIGVIPTAVGDKLAVRQERHRGYEISMLEHTTKRFAGGGGP